MRLWAMVVVGMLLLSAPGLDLASAAVGISLPPPERTGGKPLLDCLAGRHSAREFKSDSLTLSVLSTLLWAAWGENREDGHRTAPSAMNRQEIDVYVVTADRVSLYDAARHGLILLNSGDFRAACGAQEFVATAPLNLVYVADLSRMGEMTAADKDLYSAADCGFIAQNVYLYCASVGLNAVVRGWIDRPALAATLGLRADQRIILSHTIGYPK